MTKKYIFENGVMKLNPAYKDQKTTVTTPDKALAIVSSPNDIASATELQKQKTGKEMQLSTSTVASMEIMQDPEFQQQLGGSEDVLDGLGKYFAKYEVPIGLLNKLLGLMEYNLRMIIDDSGSMQNDSDVLTEQASEHMHDRLKGYKKKYMQRIHEVEDRLHILVDILSYIPTQPITISFMNTPETITLKHDGKKPEVFAADAHKQISAVFSRLRFGGTPTYRVLSEAFSTTQPTAIYLFTDGEPQDKTPAEVADLILRRQNPRSKPLTLLSCTNDDDQVEWMKTVEEQASYTSELDDFSDECKEVLKDQGPGLPFSRGFWLLCQLVAAINPDDLDALDEDVPLTKMTLDNLLGRVTTSQEYEHYFRNNPHGREHQHLFQRFATEQVHARQIVPKGSAPSAPPAPGYYTQYGAPQDGGAMAYPPQQMAPGVYPPPAYRP